MQIDQCQIRVRVRRQQRGCGIVVSSLEHVHLAVELRQQIAQALAKQRVIIGDEQIHDGYSGGVGFLNDFTLPQAVAIDQRGLAIKRSERPAGRSPIL